jgi:predicted RNA-binding protein with PIN domain
MSLQYIIDGYNIIKHPQFSQQLSKRAKDSRATLLHFIKVHRLAGSSNNKITVVFDGYPDSEGSVNNTQMKVIFSRNDSADERIKRIVESSGNAKTIVVVSDDKEIKFMTRSLGADCIGVQDFLSRNKDTRKIIDDSLKPELTYSQMEEINKELRKLWLK